MNKLTSVQRKFLEYVINTPECTKHSRLDAVLSLDGYVDDDRMYLNLLREYYKPRYHKKGEINKSDFIQKHLHDKKFSAGMTEARYYVEPLDNNKALVSWIDRGGHNHECSYNINEVIEYLITNSWDFKQR